MDPIRVLQEAIKNKDWQEDEEINIRIKEEWVAGKFSTIHPDLLRMYAEDAITIEQISKAWKVPKFYIEEMYKRSKILPWGEERQRLEREYFEKNRPSN